MGLSGDLQLATTGRVDAQQLRISGLAAGPSGGLGSGASVTVPAEATESGERITVTISNFGGMAAPALGVPGSYGAEEVEILFHPHDRARVEGALQELGYVVVSEPLLWAGYDGASVLNRFGEYPTTWWYRFLDYL